MSVNNLPISVADRSMLLCLGRYGARVLAHVWPRVGFQDLQRQTLRPNLPSLVHLTAGIVLVPRSDGSILCGRPGGSDWDDSLFRDLDHQGDRDGCAGTMGAAWLTRLSQALGESQIITAAEAPTGRGSFFRTAIEAEPELGDWLARMAHSVRGDADTGGSDANRFIVYIVASLADPESSALLWPVVMILRQTLGAYLPLRIIGLLSTGVYTQTGHRLSEAAVHTALQELAFFSDPAADLSRLALPAPALTWDDRRFLDLCFLLDNEKRNGSRCNHEEEVIVNTGNFLELMLGGDALYVIDEESGANEDEWRATRAFGSIGTASIYVPIDAWRQRNRMEYEFELLRDHVLRPPAEPDAPGTSNVEEQPTASYVDITALMDRMIAGCSLRITPPQQGAVGRLLKAAGLAPERPRKETEPLPEITIDGDALRVDYTTAEPQTHRRRRLTPDAWLAQAYRHFRRLGLAPDLILPGDPVGAAVEAEGGLPVRTRQEEWWDSIIDTCSAGADQGLMSSSYNMDISPAQRLGIEAEFRHTLRRQIAQSLRTENNGVLRAMQWLEPLAQRGQEAGTAVDRYRMLLHQAIAHMSPERARQEQRHVQRFRQLLTNRPRLAGLVSRLIILLAFLTALGNEVLPRVPFPLDLSGASGLAVIQQWFASHLPITAGLLALSTVVLVVVVIMSTAGFRLRRAMRTIEMDLTEHMHWHLNRDFVTLLYENGLGVLAGVRETLAAYNDALRDTAAQLEERRDRLARYLSEPLGKDGTFIREPMPGLDDVRRKLERDSRVPDSQDPSAPLLAADPAMAGSILEGMIAIEAAAALPRESPLAYPAEALSEARRELGYGSLAQLILSVVGRTAGRVRDIRPSADLRIERLLRQRFDDLPPMLQLETLLRRASLGLAWDDTAPETLTVSTRLVAFEQPQRATAYEQGASASGLRMVTSLDPYTITVVQIGYGIPPSAVPHFVAHATTFAGLLANDRMPLVLHDQALDAEGRYLHLERKHA